MRARVLALTVVLSGMVAASQPPILAPLVADQEKQPARPSKPQSNNPDSSERESAPIQSTLPVAAEPQPDRPDAGNQSNNEASEDWRIVWFTGILTLVAVLQFIAMIVQSKFMRDGLDETRKATKAATDNAVAAGKSADAAESALHIAERAYVHVINWNMTNVMPNTRPRLHFVVTNAGRTPATNVVVSSGVFISPVPHKEHPSLTQVGSAPVVVADAKHPYDIGLPPTDEPIHKSLETGALVIWAYVEVTYSTRFEPERRTFRTCMKYDPSVKRVIAALETSYGYAD